MMGNNFSALLWLYGIIILCWSEGIILEEGMSSKNSKNNDQGTRTKTDKED